MKGFAAKLLEMTHAQWIFCCITKHHRTKGTKVLANQQGVLRAIEQQLDMGMASVPPKDEWMMEIDHTQLRRNLLREQQYWLWGVEVTRQGGTRAEELTEGKSTSWKNIMKDGKFIDLPTITLCPKEEEAEEPTPKPSTKGTLQAMKIKRSKTTPISKATKPFAIGKGTKPAKATRKVNEELQGYGGLSRSRPIWQLPSQEVLS